MTGRSSRSRRDGPTSGRPTGTDRDDRGQSEVVGVALMLGVTVLALGGLTATIGAVVQQQAGAADAARVGADFEAALQPVQATGAHRGEVSFTEGELAVVDRQLRVLEGGSVVRTVDADALVFRRGDRRVAFVAGAVVRGTGAAARFRRPPPVSVGERILVVGAPRLNASATVAVSGGPMTVTLRTDVTHERTVLGDGTWAVAIETATPRPFAAAFRDQGATVTTRDFDDDGVVSVVARFDGRRRAYLVVHDMHLEVGRDG